MLFLAMILTLLGFRLVIVNRPGICYSYPSEPADQTRTDGSMYSRRVVGAGVGCQGLSSGAPESVRR